MQRGITQDEVWKACDALLLVGDRPTIERVRLHLGRGSPNTVSPMLDTWFKGLGARLQDPRAFAAVPNAPTPVLQVAEHLWEVASAQARGDVDARVRAGLAQAEKASAAALARADEADAHARAVAHQTEHLRGDLAVMQERLESEARAHGVAQTKCESANLRCEALEAELARTAAATLEVRRDWEQRLADVNERADANARRAALEIDSLRQALKVSNREAEQLHRQLTAQTATLQSERIAHAEKVAQLTADAFQAKTELRRAQAHETRLSDEVAKLSGEITEMKKEVHGARMQSEMAQRMLGELAPRRAASKTAGARGKRVA